MPRLVNGLEQIFTSLGIVGSGYKLFFFEYDTTTPKTTYSDQDLTVPNTNPVECDSSGRPETDVWGSDPSLYKCILATPDSTIGNITSIVTLNPIDNFNLGNIVNLTPLPAAYWGTTSGSSSAYTLDSLVPILSYSDVQCFFLDFHIANSASPTINIESLGALNLKKYTNSGTKTALEADDVLAQRYIAINDGVDIVILNPQKPYLDGRNISQATTTVKGVTLLTTTPSIANGTDTEHDIDFGAYTMQFSDGSGQAVQTAKTKRADATWASGTGNGGMASGVTLSNNINYYMFGLSNSSGSLVDFGFDSSLTATNLIADSAVTTYFEETPKWQFLAAFRTDASANIRNGQYNFAGTSLYRFEYKSRILDFSGATVTTAAAKTLSCPPNVISLLIVNQDASGANTTTLITNLNTDDDAPAHTSYGNISSSTAYSGAGQLDIFANSSSQVRIRSTSTSATLSIRIYGWIQYL